MAAYFHGGAGTDIQASADGLQTLYLMNPSFAGYADAAAAAPNMMLLNSGMGSMTPATFGNQPPPAAQHFVGVPLQPPTSGYNLWAPATTGAADMSPPQQSPGAAAVSAVLSLSSRETPPVTVAAVAATEGKYAASASSLTSAQGHLVMNSKYLKVAQELLDEVVSVSKATDEAKATAAKSAASVKKKEDSEEASGGGGGEDGGGDKSGGAAAELSTAERQELQMKRGKLINMLDEVEQRYRQYHQQMQVVAASFEAVAGAGSASTYTALALRTISRQFRCLRDAIAAQVRAASRGLGDEGAADGKTMGSRLRYIDHQLRQQRALQQLGMMQSSAWRPQRGLPERSVSILRAWLFEHFLHPYPKDSDKIMLAKQTGLTRSQVSNWFINARVRLWKPMVEEMYLEETKDQDGNAMDAGGADDNSGGSKSNNSDNADPPKPDMSSAATTKAKHVASVEGSRDVHASLLELAGEQQSQGISFYDNDGGALQPKFKRARTDEPPAFHVSNVATLHHAAAAAAAAASRDEVSHRELLMKFMECGSGGSAAGSARDHQDGGYSLFTPAYGQFGSDHFAFPGNGGVSLTLGLPHGAAEQTSSFLMSSSNTGNDDNHGVTAVTAAANGYDMNMQSTKSFAAQLMRNFVA